jgi:hypothetical protein
LTTLSQRRLFVAAESSVQMGSRAAAHCYCAIIISAPPPARCGRCGRQGGGCGVRGGGVLGGAGCGERPLPVRGAPPRESGGPPCPR